MVSETIELLPLFLWLGEFCLIIEDKHECK